MGNLPLKSCNPFNMAGLFQAFLGGSKPSASPIPAGDNDFADFAGAPEPTPAAYSAASSPVSFMGASAAPTGAAVLYTKWYNIHERHSLSDFKQEGVILAMIAVIVTVHMLGTSANRRKAKLGSPRMRLFYKRSLRWSDSVVAKPQLSTRSRVKAWPKLQPSSFQKSS